MRLRRVFLDLFHTSHGCPSEGGKKWRAMVQCCSFNGLMAMVEIPILNGSYKLTNLKFGGTTLYPSQV